MAVLFINSIMFLLEFIYSIYSGSQALLADSLDFLSDSVNYLITLFALNKSLKIRAVASLIKGLSMGMLGIWVIWRIYQKAIEGVVPETNIMLVISILALLANVFCAFLLYRYRKGDVNRESVWICSRNDAIGNFLVILAAIATYVTYTRWPDLIAAFIIVVISIAGFYKITKKALNVLL